MRQQNETKTLTSLKETDQNHKCKTTQQMKDEKEHKRRIWDGMKRCYTWLHTKGESSNEKRWKRKSVQSMCIPRGCTNVCEIMKNAQGAERKKNLKRENKPVRQVKHTRKKQEKKEKGKKKKEEEEKEQREIQDQVLINQKLGKSQTRSPSGIGKGGVWEGGVGSREVGGGSREGAGRDGGGRDTWFLSKSWSISSLSPCSWKVMMIRATKMLTKKNGNTMKNAT